VAAFFCIPQTHSAKYVTAGVHILKRTVKGIDAFDKLNKLVRRIKVNTRVDPAMKKAFFGSLRL
jgi:hypothetical protein